MNLIVRLKKVRTEKNMSEHWIQAIDILGFLLTNFLPKSSELKFLKKNL